MALKKTVKTVHGIEVVDAYHRIECIELQGKTVISYRVRSYKDVDCPSFGEMFVVSEYNLDGVNPIAQAYEHVKTLPEFADAEDC